MKETSQQDFPEYVHGIPIGEIIRSISGLRHGTVQIIIQDSKVIQVDRTEKRRITQKSEIDYSI